MTVFNQSLHKDADGQKTTSLPVGQEATATWTTPTHITGSAIAYDKADDMFKFKTNQQKWKADFAGSSLDSTKWTLVQTGSGMTVSVSGGAMTIATGTTANSETIIRSNAMFTVPFKSMFGFYISQRIANQEFYMEMVSVDPTTGLPDGKNTAAIRHAYGDSATNTYFAYQVQASGITMLTSGASYRGIADNSYSMNEIELFEDEAWFHSRAMDSTNGRAASFVRHQNIPDPNAVYKLQIRAKNLATAPASSTTYYWQFVNVNDYAELNAEITAGRGNVAAGQAMGAQILNTPTVYANLQAFNSIGINYKTAFTASQNWTGGTLDTGTVIAYNTYRVIIMNQNTSTGGTTGIQHGTLIFEQSDDNVAWKLTHQVPIPSDGNFRTVEFPIISRYVRIRFQNGSTLSTASYVNTTYGRVPTQIDLDKTITFVHNTAALAASTTMTGFTLDLGVNHSVNRHRAQVYADQAGTLQLQQSRDGSTWRVTSSQAVSASTAVVLDDLVVSRYVRVVYINGATANTICDVQSALVKN